jgi:prephenate dehydrogenase
VNHTAGNNPAPAAIVLECGHFAGRGMIHWNTVAIVGVGLIGGSIGLALRKRKLARRVVGIGRSQATLAKALARGCITELSPSLAEGVREAELVVVCTPVEQIARQLVEAAAYSPRECLFTDAGSTKGQLVAEVEAALASRYPGELPFVGSHPIAGSEKTGPDAADADLFQGRVVVITPTARTKNAAAAAVEAFWRSLGADVLWLAPERHDEALAVTSHLPHLVASALAAATPQELLPLVGSGWQDSTRIAAGDPELWRQIFLANRGATLKALDDFERVLAAFRAALSSGEGAQLAALLAEGKSRRDAVGS